MKAGVEYFSVYYAQVVPVPKVWAFRGGGFSLIWPMRGRAAGQVWFLASLS